MIRYFNTQWDTVPLVCVDTECTGKRPGFDKTVSFGLSRFENGVWCSTYEMLVNPGVPIPEESTAIHGITDDMVKDQPTLQEAWNESRVQELLKDAQPAGYNTSFDRYFVPPFGEDWTWPWMDGLTLVRKQDRYAKGKGRHKLGQTCERHGISLIQAHSAGADARAAGELLIKMGRETFPKAYSLGKAISWLRQIEAQEWARFMQWIANQPPLPVDPVP